RRHTRSKRDWSSDVCSSDLRDRAEGSPAANPGAPRQLRHHRAETCRRVPGTALDALPLGSESTPERGRQWFPQRLPESSSASPVSRRIGSHAIALADDPLVPCLAAVAALSALSRHGFTGGNLIPGNSARAPAHLRNRLHRMAL